MAIVYSSKAVSIASMFRKGLVSNLARLAALIAIGPLLTGIVFFK
jgi:hypothetical protein